MSCFPTNKTLEQHSKKCVLNFYKFYTLGDVALATECNPTETYVEHSGLTNFSLTGILFWCHKPVNKKSLYSPCCRNIKISSESSHIWLLWPSMFCFQTPTERTDQTIEFIIIYLIICLDTKTMFACYSSHFIVIINNCFIALGRLSLKKHEIIKGSSPKSKLVLNVFWYTR